MKVKEATFFKKGEIVKKYYVQCEKRYCLSRAPRKDTKDEARQIAIICGFKTLEFKIPPFDRTNARHISTLCRRCFEGEMALRKEK